MRYCFCYNAFRVIHCTTRTNIPINTQICLFIFCLFRSYFTLGSNKLSYMCNSSCTSHQEQFSFVNGFAFRFPIHGHIKWLKRLNLVVSSFKTVLFVKNKHIFSVAMCFGEGIFLCVNCGTSDHLLIRKQLKNKLIPTSISVNKHTYKDVCREKKIHTERERQRHREKECKWNSKQVW